MSRVEVVIFHLIAITSPALRACPVGTIRAGVLRHTSGKGCSRSLVVQGHGEILWEMLRSFHLHRTQRHPF